MWTSENRPRDNRDKQRYPRDLTDEEWGHSAPRIPPARRGGRRREVDVREVVNGVMYIVSTGCQWRYLPRDVPPRRTVFEYVRLWSQNRTLDTIHQFLDAKCREQAGRKTELTACIIDSQSVNSAEKGGLH